MNTPGVRPIVLQLAFAFLAASVTLADEPKKLTATGKEGETNRLPLSIRTFRLAPSAPPWLSRDVSRPESPSDVIYDYLVERGVDLAKGNGRQLFFNDRTGLLLVRATIPELDKVENVIKRRDFRVHQVLVETRIAEVREIERIAVGFDWYLGNVLGNSGGPNDNSLASAVLTEEQFRVLIRTLEQREGVDLLSVPKITTLSGRQARVQIESPEAPQQTITIPPFTAPGKDAKATWTRNYAPPEQPEVPQE